MAVKREAEGLMRDKRGAVLAEFVVAIMPLLTIFFVFLQIAALSVAKLLVKHSAVVGARAAAVMSNKNKTCPECEGTGDEEVTEGAKQALGGWEKYFTSVSAEIQDRSTREEGDGPYELVTVTVVAQYKCGVPLGRVICAGGTVTFEEKKSMPHQGARYVKD